MSKTVVFLNLCLPAFSLPDLCREFTRSGVAIADGGAIGVMHLRREERIRLHGVDCSERSQDSGAKAKQFTGDLAFGKDVTVQVGHPPKLEQHLIFGLFSLPPEQVIAKKWDE